MKYPENIKLLANLSVDFLGLIFFQKSPRYIDKLHPKELNHPVSSHMKRVGVFVDSNIDFVKKQTVKYKLNMIQLHGNESPDFCIEIKIQTGIPVIKAINISETSDFEMTKAFEYSIDYFLFDTKTNQHGGSGLKFDWNLLDTYTGSIPFFLSGGISPHDIKRIKGLSHPMLYALDLNSKFEIEAGKKDIQLLESFINEIKK